RRLEAPDRVGHQTPAFDQVPRDAHVVGRVLGCGEHDHRGDDRADRQGNQEASGGRQDRLAAAHGRGALASVGPSAHRSSVASRQIGYIARLGIAPCGAFTTKTGTPTQFGRGPPARIGASARTISSRSRTSQRVSYARATSSIVSMGSSGVTIPGRPVKYLNPALSITSRRSSGATPRLSIWLATATRGARLSLQAVRSAKA